MENFKYFTPTKVIFGKESEERAGALCAAAGAKKVLLHYGGGSVEKSGLLGRLQKNLDAAGLQVVTLGGVRPNPRLSLVLEGIELCRQQGVDFILAVGGGSAIDSAKAIGYGLANGGDVWDFYAGTRKAEKFTPLGVVLTIAAAGSEMSDSSVITNTELGQKRGYSNDLCRPLFAIMNPALTVTVPAYHTAAGCADIMMHTMERYFTPAPTTMELTDSLAESLMRTVIENAHKLTRQPEDYDARAEIMWAGALSHNGLTACGNGGGDWSVHQLGHELSAAYDLSHGAGLAAVWGSWARAVYQENPARFARFAGKVLELPAQGDVEEQALAGIAEMEEFFWAIEMPTSLAEAGIKASDADIRSLAESCSRRGTRTIGGFKVLGEQAILAIYQAAR